VNTLQRDEKAVTRRRYTHEFLKTVNGTLRNPLRHTRARLKFFDFVSLPKIYLFMRHLLYLICGFLFCSSAIAQTLPQPVMAFPFQISLLTPDSVAVQSETVLGKGKITVLAFWLSTCLPCRVELAAYTAKYAEWQRQADFQLVAISIDFPERFSQMAKMAQSSAWAFPAYWDQERAFRNILPGELNGLPQVFLFDKKGQLVWQHRRYVTGDEAELFAQIMALQSAKP